MCFKNKFTDKHYVNSVSVFEVDHKNLRIGNFLVFYALIVIVYVC